MGIQDDISALTRAILLYDKYGLPELDNLDDLKESSKVKMDKINPFYRRFLQQLRELGILAGPAKISKSKLRTGYVEMLIKEKNTGVEHILQVGLFNAILYYDGLYVKQLEAQFYHDDHNLSKVNENFNDDEPCLVQINGRYSVVSQGDDETNDDTKIYQSLKLFYGCESFKNPYLGGNLVYINEADYSLDQRVELLMLQGQFVCEYMRNVTKLYIPGLNRELCRWILMNDDTNTMEMPSPKSVPYTSVEPFDNEEDDSETRFEVPSSNRGEFALKNVDFGFYHPYLTGVVYVMPNDEGDLSLSVHAGTPWGRGQFVVKYRNTFVGQDPDESGDTDISLTFVNAPITKPGPSWLENFFEQRS